jgi:mono/diheme cytochrome c family protein
MKKLLLTVVSLCFVSMTFSQANKTKMVHKPAKSHSTLYVAIKEGGAIYTQNCVSCHQVDGGGVQNMNPTLTKTSYVLGEKKKIISIVLNGLQHQDIDGDSYQNVMPSFYYLTDKQVANVLTFVRNSFGNKASRVTVNEVKTARVKK